MMKKLWSVLLGLVCALGMTAWFQPVCAASDGSIVLHLEDRESEVALYAVPVELQNLEVDELVAALLDQGGEPQTAAITSNTIRFEQLEPGLYLLRQTRHAPNRQPFKPHLVHLQADGMQVEETPKTAPVVSNPDFPRSSRHDATLPYTAQPRWLIYVFAMLGITCLLGGRLLREPYEK
ncbi:hypothetical protein [uncultured Dubosiella sp.]|uniref:hypothetical protein n=2 Tax=uncultured Dubosiella sp. TaxID=1937011 RepID=UPI00272DCFA4|nr:hypothetical protein [uncultured Dubosiella sp.]